MSSIVFSMFDTLERRLSLMEQLCINSFLVHGHAFQLYTYGHLEGIPRGVEVLPAADILPRSAASQYVVSAGRFKGLNVPFSDLFRLKVLAERGGLWVDTDMVCLRPFNFAQAHVLSSEREPGTGVQPTKPTNTVMKAPAGSPFMLHLLESAQQIVATGTLGHQELGSILLPAALLRFNLQAEVQPAAVFCHLDYWNWERLIEHDNFEPPPLAHGLHLWNSMWTTGGRDKNKCYPTNTPYGRLQAKYL